MSTRYDRGMAEPEDDSSPLAEALARVGDRWTLLVVEALLAGPRRFNDLQGQIPGIAANILSERLRRLEREALLVARPYSERPPRAAYQLTAEGRELAGALRLLAHWGARHADPAGGSGEGGGQRGEAQHVLGAGQVGERHEHGPHAALGQQPVAANVVVGGAGVVALGEGRGGGAAAQFLHDRCGVLAVAADDRDVQHGDFDLCGIAPGGGAVPAQDGELAVQRAGVGRKVAAIAEPGGDGQRAPLTGTADDDRDPRHRPRIAGRLGQPDPLAPVRPGAGLPQGTERLDGRLQLVEPGRRRRERQAETRVLA